MKMTVSDYAKMQSVSAPAIYQQIKKNKLETIKEDGKTYIIVNDNEAIEDNKPIDKQVDNSLLIDLEVDYKSQKKYIKLLKKEIKKLNKQLDKKDKIIDRNDNIVNELMKQNAKLMKQVLNESNKTKEVYETYFQHTLSYNQNTTSDTNIDDVEIVETSKKKKKKKKK